MRYLLIIASVLAFQSCVSKTAYEELSESRNYYKQESKVADSLRLVNTSLYERNRNLEADLNKAERELDQASVTNQALRRNYEELLAEYNKVITTSRSLVATSAYDKQKYTEQLAIQEAELDLKRRQAAAMEYALQAREDRLDAVETYDTFGSKGASGNTGTMTELNTILEYQQRLMTQIQASLNRAMAAYGPAAAQVSLKDNRVMLVLHHSLLFTEGGFQPSSQGIQALNAAASVLSSYPDVEVQVIGRGDSYGASDTNWEYAIQRASAVGRTLAAAGVNPSRILASGQGPGFSSALGIRAVVNQTDIIISPNMDRVNQLLAR